MLTELRIVNFALIEQLHIQFKPGFTVLTGETGAGKSLLIDAIGLLVGGRGSAEQIRSGEEEATLEASFHLPAAHPLWHQLRSMDLVGPDDDFLVLRRILSRSGRHRVYLNGSLSPLRVLEALGGTLVDIHGQHEQQSLLSTAKQLDAVDSFASIQPLRGKYEEAYREWKDIAAQLESAHQAGMNRDRLGELLRFQIQEIEQAGLKADEEETLATERKRLVHAHRLRELAEEAYADLQADDQGVLVRLGRIGRLLGELGRTDSMMGDSEQPVLESSVQLKELASRLRAYADQLDADPDRQARVESRLEQIHRLKVKYGGSVESIMADCSRMRVELHEVETRESRIEELSRQLEEAKYRASELAMKLSKKRREAARGLTDFVAAELAAVKMEQASFDIIVSSDDTLEAFGPSGRDRVEFVLSGNAGEPARPLRRIASGGEISRVMLALKTALAETDQVPVLVFDEIDSGVGGAVAAAMGSRLRKLGEFHQVFCITHLPQVASQAEHHLLVEKQQDRRRTTTSVKFLNGIGREEEIARMLGGKTITKKVLETAAELIADGKGKR
ncbi:DNA repair protein RecN [Petrachloros mirabilis]